MSICIEERWYTESDFVYSPMITAMYVCRTSYIYSIDFYICRRQLTHIIMSSSTQIYLSLMG